MNGVYNLSDKAHGITWKQWLAMGGCAIPNSSLAPLQLGPVSRWEENGVTLGKIAESCPSTGRSLARFALDHLFRKDLAVPYNQEEK